MCGIAGEIRFDNRPASVDRVSRMVNQMKTRGPDASGTISQNNVALGHSRLKIIDLSEKGQQPMTDPHLGLSLVFNGCIYNYRPLRRLLQRKGYQFYSNTDSEVILKAYHAWGEQCVTRFNGMFAFAIHERDTGKVYLARDRLGIKPLYYFKSPGVLRFASSLPALVKASRMAPSINKSALNHYMTFHSVVPAPLTLFDKICKLPPGHYCTFNETGFAKMNSYWSVDFDYREATELNASEDTIVHELERVLRGAAKRRLEADVPVGVLLSGGVDSSLVVGLLAELGQKDLKTFSVGFEDHPEEDGNEFKYSDIIAREFDTEHHKFTVTSEEIIEHLPECLSAMSEPMVSHDNIGFYLLSKKVSEHVKVVQSGQGADELFGGYHWYRDLADSQDPLNDYSAAFFDRDYDEFRQAVSAGYVDGDYSRRFVAEAFDDEVTSDPVNKALKLDSTVMLTDDPVKRVDNMTMAWGLEARVPFLDHKVVELAAKIHPRYKIKNGGKHILKETARRIIPASVIDRPKGYFPVPALKYLRGPVLDYVRDSLTNTQARQRGVFNQDYVNELLNNPLDHITPLQGSKLWQLASFELWMQNHGF